MRTNVLLFIIVLSNAVGNILMGYGMQAVGDISSFSPVDLVMSGLQAIANPWVAAGVVLLLVFFVAHALVLTQADLSYVLLTTSLGYALVAFLSWAFLDEHVSIARWAGTIIITAGVALVGSTPPSTVGSRREASR